MAASSLRCACISAEVGWDELELEINSNLTLNLEKGISQRVVRGFVARLVAAASLVGSGLRECHWLFRARRSLVWDGIYFETGALRRRNLLDGIVKRSECMKVSFFQKA